MIRFGCRQRGTVVGQVRLQAEQRGRFRFRFDVLNKEVEGGQVQVVRNCRQSGTVVIVLFRFDSFGQGRSSDLQKFKAIL